MPDPTTTTAECATHLPRKDIFEAYKSVLTLIGQTLEGSLNPGVQLRKELPQWHLGLFSRASTAGIVTAVDLAGYRKPSDIHRGSHACATAGRISEGLHASADGASRSGRERRRCGPCWVTASSFSSIPYICRQWNDSERFIMNSIADHRRATSGTIDARTTAGRCTWLHWSKSQQRTGKHSTVCTDDWPDLSRSKPPQPLSRESPRAGLFLRGHDRQGPERG
jgi:hypothetical protein